jgi:CheY-like chemotaxis protein
MVDDHPLIQEAVGNVLRRLDAQAEIAVAGDCERGLAIAGHGAEPDLVLLDPNLPGLAEIPTLKLWRARFPGVPVVGLSATIDPASSTNRGHFDSRNAQCEAPTEPDEFWNNTPRRFTGVGGLMESSTSDCREAV